MRLERSAISSSIALELCLWGSNVWVYAFRSRISPSADWSVQFAERASCFSSEHFRPSNSVQMWPRWVCGLIRERRVFLRSIVMSGGVFLCRGLKCCGVCGCFVHEGSHVCRVMETLVLLPEWEKQEHCKLPVAPNENLLVHTDRTIYLFVALFVYLVVLTTTSAHQIHHHIFWACFVCFPFLQNSMSDHMPGRFLNSIPLKVFLPFAFPLCI